MELSAKVNLDEQASIALEAVCGSSSSETKLVHNSGRCSVINTNGELVMNGDLKALTVKIDYEPKNGDLTIADLHDGLRIFNGMYNVNVSVLH
ncbi:hypothetical protein [Vibrio sp. Evd11]|uniref:hypothetical protein n=1 Tax=Vibrio sp. Evd11 TaxID=1207404 RepID=UPI000EFCBE6D|nr:hypothetical protein [Vibrio sp. Evd11]